MIFLNLKKPKIRWKICDDDGKTVFNLEGPNSAGLGCGKKTSIDSVFPLLNNAGDEVGKIQKDPKVKFKENLNSLQKFAKVDTFSIEFPPHLDVKMKATLLYAAFLIVSL